MEKYKAKYWNNKGKYQKEYDELWGKLVPVSGACETIKGELLRCIGRIYYDVYNNGGCNLSLRDYFIVFVDEHYESPEWDTVKDAFKGKKQYAYIEWDNESFMKALDKVVDAIVKDVYEKVKVYA